MQKRDIKVLGLARKFLTILRKHTDRYEALDALRIAERLFSHPLIKETKD
jgi:hypothetical protein